MIPLTSSQIATIADGTLLQGDGGRVLSEVVIDSRQVRQGACFVAIIGPRDDGHRYLQQALAAGAAAVVVSRAGVLEHLVNPDNAAVVLVTDTTEALQRVGRHVRDAIDPLVVAITGSIGKTTTKTLARALLSGSFRTHATPGNYNNQWGLPLSLLGMEADDEVMIAELGMSAPGEIAELTALARPGIGVITNVAPVHMANFDGLDGVAAAKRELAEGLPADGTLIVNADDRRTAAMAEQLATRLERTLSFSVHTDADVVAHDPRRVADGWELTLRLPDGETVAVQLPLLGEHSLANFLAAAAIAHVAGVGAEAIAARAARLALPTMRGQVHRTDAGVTVIDDSYNASPAAMMSALEALAALPGDGRLVLAAGDMLELGSWAEDAHREVGLHAAHLGVGLIVTVGPLARDIGHGALAGGVAADAVHGFGVAEEAAEALSHLVEPGDRVLVKGSRAVRMERLTQALLEAVPAARGEEGDA